MSEKILYLEDPKYGWGLVQKVDEKRTEVFFPKVGSTKSFSTKIVRPKIQEETPEIIKALNQQFKRSKGPPENGSGWSAGGQPQRDTICYVCKKHIDNENDFVCLEPT